MRYDARSLNLFTGTDVASRSSRIEYVFLGFLWTSQPALHGRRFFIFFRAGSLDRGALRYLSFS